MTKKCFVCNLEKDLSEFYKHSAMKDGYLNKCKTCCKKQANERRFSKLEEIRAYDRNRPNKEERLKKSKEYRLKLRIENPEKFDTIFHEARRRYRAKYIEKRIAVDKVAYAIKTGKLKRPEKCELCKTCCTPEAHHYDYAKPLTVVWVCTKCHAKIHKELRTQERKLLTTKEIL